MSCYPFGSNATGSGDVARSDLIHTAALVRCSRVFNPLSQPFPTVSPGCRPAKPLKRYLFQPVGFDHRAKSRDVNETVLRHENDPAERRQAARRSLGASAPAPAYSRFAIHYYFYNRSDSIGAPSSNARLKWQALKTTESCRCSIHDEGLREHPIKNRKLANLLTSLECKQSGHICQFAGTFVAARDSS